MGTARIQTTIAVEREGVFLFETGCIAEVAYELDGNALYDFAIDGFIFEKTESRWNGEVFGPVKTGEVLCPPALREILLEHADYAGIEEQLIEQLTASGEIKPASAKLRADHHAAVL